MSVEDRGLSAHLTITRELFPVEVHLEVPAGTTVALLGPNGAGKSTVLAGIAGTAALDDGRITLAGRVLSDTQAGIDVPLEHRRIGMVFQDYVLFPHLSVLENVAFGPRSQGRSRGEARERADEQLRRLGIGELAARRPGELSGGQAQRVAVARALVVEPDALLLDEPLAALDVEVRADVRVELAEHLATFGGVTVVVTHSLADARALADHIVVLERGLVTQRGTASELADAPATAWIERLSTASD